MQITHKLGKSIYGRDARNPDFATAMTSLLHNWRTSSGLLCDIVIWLPLGGHLQMEGNFHRLNGVAADIGRRATVHPVAVSCFPARETEFVSASSSARAAKHAHARTHSHNLTHSLHWHQMQHMPRSSTKCNPFLRRSSDRHSLPIKQNLDSGASITGTSTYIQSLRVLLSEFTLLPPLRSCISIHKSQLATGPSSEVPDRSGILITGKSRRCAK
jgi:hypothetical protein